MKHTIEVILITLLLMMAAANLTSCSSSDDTNYDPVNTDYGVENETEVPNTLLHQEPLWSVDRDFQYINTSSYKTMEGSTWLWHDDLGRLTSIMLYIPALMDINVLYNSPSSIEQLNGKYYQLGSDNQLILYDKQEFEGQVNGFNTSGMATGFEYYNQYFKGLKVFGKGFTVNYYLTPRGKRLAYVSGQILTGLTVDTNPIITANQAKRILGARLGEKLTKDWEAELLVREFIIKDGDKTETDERLVWHIKGTQIPKEESMKILASSSMVINGPLRHEAQIDAHTGRLLIEGNTLSFIYQQH